MIGPGSNGCWLVQHNRRGVSRTALCRVTAIGCVVNDCARIRVLERHGLANIVGAGRRVHGWRRYDDEGDRICGRRNRAGTARENARALRIVEPVPSVRAAV